LRIIADVGPHRDAEKLLFGGIREVECLGRPGIDDQLMHDGD